MVLNSIINILLAILIYFLHVQNHKNEENRNDPKSEIKSAHGPIAYKDNFMVNSLPENLQHEKDVSNEPNPSDIDIVDYTPARKKSPIHN
ncbi:putative Root meristem growth factor 9 [Helianthus anomalus]